MNLQDYLNQLNQQRNSINGTQIGGQFNTQYAQQFQNIQYQFSQNFQWQAESARGILGRYPGATAAAEKIVKLLPVDPKTRIAEIDKELDVIRGIKPTPKGYKIDLDKAKALMAERSALSEKIKEAS